ncbi:PREDICTED: pentatricopeptide repeat-containing protein At1g76280 [Lupinus angustifolius]|nr:PREDICTED: pentatricopeptide repeat-containing protein At1g76280 [Lupinus angustifolius]XP_019453378.1 PREDICTED: pentatricopeptide repeat-containing protein At1g76280 [Lupinus angustifolius]
MNGFRATWFSLRSICKSKWHHHHQHHGDENITREFQFKFSRNLTITTTSGTDYMEPVMGSYSWSVQKQIVDALRLGERTKASDLLLDFGHKSSSLRAGDFVDIFKYCAESPDPLFVMEIWRLMEAKNVSLNDICLSLMTKALSKGGYLEEAFNMMDFLGETQRLYPGLPLYNSFLRCCTKMQSIIHASKCLDLMEKRTVGKNEVTYAELLKLAVLQKNLPAVHLIWDEYIKYYSVSIIVLRRFIWSFTRLGDINSAYKTLQQMVSLAITEDTSIARTVYEKLYSTRLDIPVPSNREIQSTMLDLKENKEEGSSIRLPFVNIPDAISDNIEQQIILMGNKSEIVEIDGLNGQKQSLLMEVLTWSFNDVIHGFAKCKNYTLARRLISQMQNLGLQPSSHTYDAIVKVVVSQSYKDGMAVLKKMHQKNLKPFDSTLATLSVSCSRALQLDLAEALLNRISECLYPHPYNALLEACDATNQPERAVQVFAKMKQKKLLPDIRTYELLFTLFGTVNAPYEDGNMLSQMDAAKRINAIERDMAKNGIQHSQLSMKILLKALGEEGMITELIQYLQVAENLFFYGRNPSLGTEMYNIALHYLVKAKESHMAIEIFKKMKLCGCQLDSATYNIMIDCCSIIRSYRYASLLLSMMIREGFYPVTCTYTSLIKILLEDENFSEALYLLERVRLDGIQLDVLLFNTFLRQACHKERIDVIEYIVECMHREKIQPSPASCGYVFSAYVNAGFHNTAIEALQVLSLRMMSPDGNILKKKEHFVDEFILAEDLDVESHVLKLFKDSEEELVAGLLNLRWCAVVGVPICESADQSPWAKRLELQFFERRPVP